ncbi:MAG: prenyltransferase/squalene oxidase repeat-containing protein [Thermoguttaceae bacterium]
MADARAGSPHPSALPEGEGTYHAALMLRWMTAATGLPEDLRRRHGAWLAAAQREDGGFAGRRGASDVYYTGFALRGLAMLGQLTSAVAGRAGDFLAARAAGPLAAAEFVSLLAGTILVETAGGGDVFARAGRDRRQMVLDIFGPLRRGDGGYAKSARSTQSSLYQTFLAVLCGEMVGLAPEGAAAIVALVRSRRRGDGGFAELAAIEQSGTSPTAAAVGLLTVLGAVDEGAREGVVRFLAAMQTPAGGLRAHARLPLADLLSTFSGSAALADLGAGCAIDRAAAAGFARGLERPEGGFRAAAWDGQADVEYTFYGLAVAACAPLAV